MHRHERPLENLNVAEARRGIRKVKETKIDIEEKRKKKGERRMRRALSR